jgi:hypothetical protein
LNGFAARPDAGFYPARQKVFAKPVTLQRKARSPYRGKWILSEVELLACEDQGG